MGACLKVFFAKSSPSRPAQDPLQPSAGLPTERPIVQSERKQEEPSDPKGSLNDLSNNNQMRGDTKIFTNNGSTGIGFSEQERRSSIFFGNPFETSSILMKNVNERCEEPKEGRDQFYTLIDKIYFIRKSMDTIKVSSPHGNSELNCPVNNITSTFYLTQGLPLESIKQVTTGKIIQISNSPIRISLKVKCLTCARTLKLTFSKSIIEIARIQCDNCSSQGEWGLLDLTSNFPIWGDGRKIELEEDREEKLPSPLRALGCISCLRYSFPDQNVCKEYACGCLLCSNCLETNPINQCHLCQN